MKKQFLFGLLMLLVFRAKAQKDFRPGYIVKDGDTLRGLIRFAKPKINALACQYKSSIKGKKVKYTPNEISAYGFLKGNRYRSYLLTETSTILSERNSAPKRYFLNELVSGKADLFFVRDIAGQSRYFIQKDTIFQELIIRESVIRKADGRKYKQRTNLYVGMLSYLMVDCKTAQSEIQATKLKISSITKTFKNYNNCIHPDSLYFAQDPIKSNITFGLTVGANYSLISFSPPYAATKLGMTNQNKPGFLAGLTLNSTLPFLDPKLSLQSDFLFVRNNFKSSYHFLQYEFGNRQNQYMNYNLKADFSLNSLKVPVQFRYTLNFKKLKPFINGGIILSYDLSIKERGLLELHNWQNSKLIPVFGNFEHGLYSGFIGGIGLDFSATKQLTNFLEIRFQPEGFNQLYGVPATINTYSINTGFRF